MSKHIAKDRPSADIKDDKAEYSGGRAYAGKKVFGAYL
jgi:hypothetical protein